MSSPYQVSPPQGNLIGSIMDFIGQNRALQLDAGTRNQINSQTGYGPTVDPFQVQKYQGESQRQQIAGDMNQRAATEQQWQGADRNSQAAVLGGLTQQFANDPVLGPIIANGGANPMIGQSVMQMLGQDRNNQQHYENTTNQYGVQHAYNIARDAQQNQQALEQIHAQLGGRSGGAGNGRLYPDSAEGIKLRQAYVNGQLGREDVIAAGVWDETLEQGRQDFLYNQTKQKEQQDAEAVKALIGKNKTDPKQVAAGGPGQGATFYGAQQPQNEPLREVGGRVESMDFGRSLAEAINSLLGINGGGRF